MTIEQNPHGPEVLVGDPDDPILASDLDTLDGHEAQDEAFDHAAAMDGAFEAFMAGIRDSDRRWDGPRYSSDVAYAIGHDFGMTLQDAIGLDAALAPLWDALVKP